MTECVLCDWTYDPQATPLAAYLIGAYLPLRWYPDGPGPVTGHTAITPQSVASVATVAHWAEAHPQQLEWALGEGFEVRLLGTNAPPPPPPPVDTVLGVDIAKGGEATIVKATKVWVAPLTPEGMPKPDVWLDVGSLITPLEFRYKMGYEE